MDSAFELRPENKKLDGGNVGRASYIREVKSKSASVLLLPIMRANKEEHR